MKKAVAILLFLLLLILPCMGCEQTGQLRKVELHEVTRSVFYAPQYVAKSLGFFED